MIRFETPFKLDQFSSGWKREDSSSYLGGSLLIAMPSLQDPCFKKSVVLMLSHDDTKAFGIIINKPAGYVQFGRAIGEGQPEILENMQLPVFFGGPVDNELAMVVHSHCETEYETTQIINENFGVTSNIGILEDISCGEGPSCNIFTLGYSCWAPGQLESEIQDNSWLVGDSSLELVFKTSTDDKWDAAIRSLGVNPSLLSSSGGTA